MSGKKGDRERFPFTNGKGDGTQTELKQAQVAAIRAMKGLDPALLLRKDANGKNPEIGQAGANQKPLQAFWLCKMTLMQVKATTLVVREHRLNPKAQTVVAQRLLWLSERTDQIDWLITNSLML
ncbi:MAG: hypothetical protein OHK0022_53480 [Roseiflexaceae bacterium]